MKIKTAVACTCAILMVFLIVESWCAPKNKLIARNWGPQSMLYLKGRYGRRSVSDSEEQYTKLDLEDLNAVLKSYKKFNFNEIYEHQKKANSSRYGH